MDIRFSKIYKIVPKNGGEYGDVYYGSTSKTDLKDRFARHKHCYSSFKNGKKLSVCASFILFEKYGVENCEIIQIEIYPCDNKKELYKREAYFILNNKCVNIAIPISLNNMVYDHDKNKEELKNIIQKYKKNEEEIKPIIEEPKEDIISISNFIKDCIIKNNGTSIKKTLLYEKYIEYCNKNNIKEIEDKIKVYKQMEIFGYIIKKNNGIFVYKNIMINSI